LFTAGVIYLISLMIYFGDFLPNTFYLKVSGQSIFQRIQFGINYLLQFSLPVIAPFILFILMSFLELRKHKYYGFLLLLLLIFSSMLIYTVYIGGDYAEEEVGSTNRFITSSISCLFILFAVGI